MNRKIVNKTAAAAAVLASRNSTTEFLGYPMD